MKKLARVFACAGLCALLCCALVACGSSSDASKNTDPNTVTTKASGKYATGTHHAVVKVEGFDPFTIELYADSAPVTVANFCNLAESGYYDGLKFYRIVEGFCLQGGTKGNSSAGNDAALPPIIGEFYENDVDNPLADDFKRGTVAMARTGIYNSAKTTFFITLASTENVELSLNGQYAAFGQIDDAGMQTVDAIVNAYLKYATGDMGAINNPKNMPTIEYISIED
ncbi:MAG: peptidylprolyl isomerase [Coriobacteriales bacterium]